MPTALTPEVVGLIAAQLLSAPLIQGRHLNKTMLESQAELAGLLRLSKAVHEQCAPLLYRECLVDNGGPLASALLTNPDHPIRYVRRLHLANAPHSRLNLYTYMFRQQTFDWRELDVSAGPGQPEPWRSVSQAYDGASIVAISLIIRKHQDAGKVMLPNLTRVVVRAATQSYHPSVQEQLRNYTEPMGSRSMLALQMLDHPSVEHYCQTFLLGSLALDQLMIKVPHPPAIVTYHLPLGFPFAQPGTIAPVVLGSINRYIFPGQIKVDFNPPHGAILSPIQQVHQIVKSITDTLGLVDNVLVKADQGDDLTHRPLSDFPDAVRNTIIELCGAIPYDSEHGPTVCGVHGYDTPREARDLSGSLAPAQALLDELAGHWKGQVVLKHRDDTPPCTACDLDCQEQWEGLPYLLKLNAIVVDVQ